MTDRLKGCWVAFDSDIRDDDAEPLLEAIRMLKGVAGVTGSVTEASDWMARQRVRSDLSGAILDCIDKILGTKT